MKEITDEQALAVVEQKVKSNSGARIATVFVPRTIVYPVTVRKASGEEEIEIRTFVRMYEYTSEARWERAQEIEKKYKKLNDAYTKSRKDAGFAVTAKEKANPMNFTPLGRE